MTPNLFPRPEEEAEAAAEEALEALEDALEDTDEALDAALPVEVMLPLMEEETAFALWFPLQFSAVEGWREECQCGILRALCNFVGRKIGRGAGWEEGWAYQSNTNWLTDTVSITYHGIPVGVGCASGEDTAGDILNPI